jgi:hypothetical protein
MKITLSPGHVSAVMAPYYQRKFAQAIADAVMEKISVQAYGSVVDVNVADVDWSALINDAIEAVKP